VPLKLWPHGAVQIQLLLIITTKRQCKMLTTLVGLQHNNHRAVRSWSLRLSA